MKIESIKLKNFKNSSYLEITEIPDFNILISESETGESTLFSVFEFLQEALKNNINIALNNIGGKMGFQETQSQVRMRPIEITISLRIHKDYFPLDYYLIIEEKNGRAVIEQEELVYHNKKNNKSLKLFSFKQGEGSAIFSELIRNREFSNPPFETFSKKFLLISDDVLAIKGPALFDYIPEADEIAKFIGGGNGNNTSDSFNTLISGIQRLLEH